MAAPSPGDSERVAYFTEMVPGTETARLVAAVAWRGTPDRLAARGGRGPGAWLRRLRQRLWLRLGPLGNDVHLRNRPLFRGTGSVTSIGFAEGGEAAAYHAEGSGVVRVLGRVYRLPRPGRVLVLLVDATRPGAAPRITVRSVATPAAVLSATPPPDWPFAPGEGTVMLFGQDPAWTAALRADPTVRAFLDGRAGA